MMVKLKKVDNPQQTLRSPTSVLRFNLNEETNYRTHRAISSDKVSPRRRFPDHASKTHRNLASTTDLISHPFYILFSTCKTSINKILRIIQIGNLQLFKK
ncbi:hypothetical protein Bca4012_005068 [Brassica carinata]|uniref:(rape) hypothetical protein n=1 Tax=Brassica napus TaxID=3708 RepID=A0A816IID1_BRANA|nr:unnamed protein product [Brassica napus]